MDGQTLKILDGIKYPAAFVEKHKKDLEKLDFYVYSKYTQS